MLVLSRDLAVQFRDSVTVVEVTRTVRGIPTEVRLGSGDGMPAECVVNADVLTTVSKSRLERRVCVLGGAKMRAIEDAVRFALALP